MQYKVEPIGAEFSKKGIAVLEDRLTSRSSEGFEFHSVFQIQQPGCLGFGKPTVTYLAVYVKQ